MNVFLTGATGYIGSTVAAALERHGHSVAGLARSASAEQKLRTAGIQPVPGSLGDPASLERAARASDGVIHTASTNDASAGDADLTAIEAILDALEGSGKPFVYTSGIWVYGELGGRVADETTAVNPAALVAWRPAVERRVLAAAARGVRAIVLRPAMVYGKGGGLPGLLSQSAREGGAARYVGEGRNHWPVIHVDDLAELYVLALERAPAGTLLVAASGEAVPLGEIAKAASEGAGAAGRTVSWPLAEARPRLGPFADALALDQRASGERARSLLGWRPTAPGIIDALRTGR